MRVFRRALFALGATSVVAIILKVTGADVFDTQQGGWRELSGPELR